MRAGLFVPSDLADGVSVRVEVLTKTLDEVLSQ